MTQPSPTSIAANLSCLLYLARRTNDGDGELLEPARVLLCASAGLPLEVEANAAKLIVDGVPVPEQAPGARDVCDQLLAHGVSGLRIPPETEPGDVVRLARTLAAYPGVYESWEELLSCLGSAASRISLTRAGTELTVIQLEEARGTRLSSTGQAQFADDGGLIMPAMDIVDYSFAPRPSSSAASGGKGDDPRILERLIDRGQSADRAGDYASLLDVANDFLQVASRTSSEAGARVYRMELRRLVTRQHLTQFARMAGGGKHREMAIEVLRQMGPEAAEVLMDLLVDADSLAERRGFYSTLARMPDGAAVIIHHLDHPTWYVVRNAAELSGEMGLAKAVPALARQATNPDERVRKSVAVALNRIGTPDALEPLGRMLKDSAPGIRLQVLGNLHGAKGRALAMPLAAMLETEDHPDVLREILRALGRIGTPDALLALRRVAQGEVRRLGKRPRTQAIESLATAGAPAAQILRSLVQDPDPEIGGAATRALEGVPA